MDISIVVILSLLTGIICIGLICLISEMDERRYELLLKQEENKLKEEADG